MIRLFPLGKRCCGMFTGGVDALFVVANSPVGFPVIDPPTLAESHERWADLSGFHARVGSDLGLNAVSGCSQRKTRIRSAVVPAAGSPASTESSSNSSLVIGRQIGCAGVY